MAVGLIQQSPHYLSLFFITGKAETHNTHTHAHTQAKHFQKEFPESTPDLPHFLVLGSNPIGSNSCETSMLPIPSLTFYLPELDHSAIFSQKKGQENMCLAFSISEKGGEKLQCQ